MKLTVDRIENNIAICEYEENGEILKKEIPLKNIPFEVTEGTIFTEADSDDGAIIYKLAEKEEEERRQRVRGKLNKLFGRK